MKNRRDYISPGGLGSSDQIGENRQREIFRQMKAPKAEKYFVYFPLLKPHSWWERSAARSKAIYSEFP